MTIEQYLQKLSRFADDPYGRQIRRQFRDCSGTSELAMLQSPSGDELEQMRRAVAVMTEGEKKDPVGLSQQQLCQIAADCGADTGVLAMFFNGYAIEAKREETRKE